MDVSWLLGEINKYVYVTMATEQAIRSIPRQESTGHHGDVIIYTIVCSS